MSIIGLVMNVLLAGLLLAALVMGWRLNRRLKALRDSHDGFAVAVRELNAAATRAEQGLADLRSATDEAVDELADRIEKGRALAAKLERLIDNAPAAPAAAPSGRPRAMTEGIAAEDIRSAERRLGALLAAARDARPERSPARAPEEEPERVIFRDPTAPPPRRLNVEDDLFEDEPLILDALRGARR